MTSTAQLRTYFIGNSVTDTINQAGLDALVESGGGDLIWGRHMIPGAPLSWIWEHPNDGFQQQPYGYYPNALDNYQWDVLSLQPFDRPIRWSYQGEEQGDLQMASNFIDRARRNSSNLQVYLYQRWVRKPNGDPNPDAEDWNRLWLETYGADTSFSSIESRSYFERLRTRLQDAFPDLKPIRIVPVGEVFFALNQKMQNGQVPGYSSIWDLYTDHIHLNNVGSFIVGSTYYATLFGADATTLPIPNPYRVQSAFDRPITPALESIIEQTVLSVVGITPPSPTTPGATNPLIGSTTSPPPPAIGFTIDSVDMRVLEGRDQTAFVTVRLSGASSQPITVSYRTADGTAQAGSDYQANSGTLTFNPGETTQTIALSILNNAAPEPEETFTLMLSNPSSGTLLNAKAIVTVSDVLQSTTSTGLPSGMDVLMLTGTANLSGIGNGSDNVLMGNAGSNLLAGKAGNDLLVGEAGADRLRGETGKDRLRGGEGNDILTGGLDGDRFVFNAGALFTLNQFGLDRLTDFTAGVDRISLNKTTFTRLQSSAGRSIRGDEWAIVRSDAAAARQSALIVYNASSGNLFYNENGSAAGFGNGGKFAILEGAPAIVTKDFLIQS